MSRYDNAKGTDVDDFFENHLTCYNDDILFIDRIKKIITLNFPQKISEHEIAGEFKRTPRWLQVKCKKAFNINYIRLVRALRVYSALKLMTETNENNVEIAERLNYTELSSMNRDFKKELNFYPDIARIKLITMNVDLLFHTFWHRKSLPLSNP